MYHRLGVSEQSSMEERKKAYRSITRLIHPDTVRGEATKLRFNEALARVNEAYEILRDPIKETLWRSKRRPKEEPREKTNQSQAKRAEAKVPTAEEELGKEFERATYNSGRNLDAQQIFVLVGRLQEKQHLSSYRQNPILLRGVQQFIKVGAMRAAEDPQIRPQLLHALILLYKAMGFPLEARMGRKLQSMVISEIDTILASRATDSFSLLPHYLTIGNHLDSQWKASLRTSTVRPTFQRRFRALLNSRKRTRREEVERCYLLEMQEAWAICSPQWVHTTQEEAFEKAVNEATTLADIRSAFDWTKVNRDTAYRMSREALSKALEACPSEKSISLISFIRYGLGEELTELPLLNASVSKGLEKGLHLVKKGHTTIAHSVSSLISSVRVSLTYTPPWRTRLSAAVVAAFCSQRGWREESNALRSSFQISYPTLLLGHLLALLDHKGSDLEREDEENNLNER